MPILWPNPMWPDAEKTAVAWMKQQIPDAKVVTETGTDLETLVTQQTSPGVYRYAGVVQVLKVPGGGSSPDELLDEALVDVYCYCRDRASMWLLARRSQAAMVGLAGHAAAGAFVDRIITFTSPGEVAYANPNLRRCVASYQLTTLPQAV